MAQANEEPHTNGLRKSVSQAEQALRASLRPLPIETGDGTYIKEKSPTGLVRDMSHMDLKDIGTILDVVKNAASGSPIDDREYVMERVIQVCYPSFAYMVAF